MEGVGKVKIQKSRPREFHRDADSAQDALRTSGRSGATPEKAEAKSTAAGLKTRATGAKSGGPGEDAARRLGSATPSHGTSSGVKPNQRLPVSPKKHRDAKNAEDPRYRSEIWRAGRGRCASPRERDALTRHFVGGKPLQIRKTSILTTSSGMRSGRTFLPASDSSGNAGCKNSGAR